MIKGIAASSGISIGKPLVLKDVEYGIKNTKVQDVQKELEKFHLALKTSKDELIEVKKSTLEKLGKDSAEIFEAHLLMLDDPELIGEIENNIKNESQNVEFAVQTTVDNFAIMFEQLDNEYMKERASDIRDIGKRLLNNLLQVKNVKISNLKDDCIIVTKDLTPSDTAGMDHEKVLGIVTDIGGSTSHSAIMARSLEIPAVLGLGNISQIVKNGDFIIIDGDEGLVIVNPDNESIKKYTEKQHANEKSRKELKRLLSVESITIDGRKVELAANIGTLDNLASVLANGAEGIGLFRTEFLYMNRDNFPSEEEQFKAYKAVLEEMKGKNVVIRTLDIGGDKQLPYLAIEKEMNPFLGYRAIRLCLDREDIFKVQLRALLRASVFGNLAIMFPMISGLEELRKAKAVLEKVKQELRSEAVSFSEKIQIGIMIEIPSAAVISDVLAKEVDFFSIGTNDLIQYTVAVDRMNQKISYLYDPFNPAVIRLIKSVIDNAHREGKWVGMCGEMAGDTRLTALLMGFGLDEFSMSPSSILKVRKIVTNIEYSKAKKMGEHILNLGTAKEIEEYVIGNI